jgi:hypothetical protein
LKSTPQPLPATELLTLGRTRRHQTRPQAARLPRRRHDECKVAFKPPVRWTLPAKTHPRELPTNAPRRLAPTSPSFPPTTSPAGCPRSGTSGLKATLLSPTPSTLARAHRAHEPRDTLPQTRHHRTPPQAARPPRRRHDECKVAFKPPVRWTLPAKTHPRELPTHAPRRLAPTSPSFPPTTSPARCPRSGTSGLKATLPSPTPSTLARAHRTQEPRATLLRTRRHRTPAPSRAATPPTARRV